MEIYDRIPKIYLIGGKARHGKTATGKMIKEEYDRIGKKTAILSHMNYLKDYLKDHFGWDGREETKPREMLQQIGTEIIRKKLGKDYFYVNRITEDIEILSYFFDIIVVDDVRFKIEIDKQRKNFKNVVAIKILRENFDNGLTEKQKEHATEVDLDDYDEFDYTINNDGDIDDLRVKVIEIVKNVEGNK